MKCKNCGEENLSVARFCYKCGHPLDGDATEDNSYKETSAEVTGAAAGNARKKPLVRKIKILPKANMR